MTAKWLRPTRRQALVRYITGYQHPRVAEHTHPTRRWTSGYTGARPALESKFEESFFPSNTTKSDASFSQPEQSLPHRDDRDATNETAWLQFKGSVTARRLLGKARLNGIDTLEKLRFEADIGHTQDIGSRMTDKSQHRQDLDLWLLLLEFSQHRYGVKGSRSIWRAMMARGKPVKLESHNRNASDLIKSVIGSAVEDIPFLREFCRDCVRRNIFHEELFVWVIGTLLQRVPKAAPNFTILLKDSCFQDHRDLVEVFQIACQSEMPDSLERFCQVRDCLPDFKVYGDLIPYLWELKRPSDAFMLHTFLLSKGDFPRTFEVLKPFVQHITESGGDIEHFLQTLSEVHISFEAQIQRCRARIIARTSQAAKNHVSEDEPSNPSDSTVARALATFPFDAAIRSFKFFGLVEIGPMSLRQIVRSSTDLAMLKELFQKLEEYEIDTGSSAYARLLRRIMLYGTFEKAKELAESDMHHEEYEDQDLQRRLLKQFFMMGDREQVNNTLAILHHGRINPNVQRHSANLLLRSAIASEDRGKILDLVTHMCHQGFAMEVPSVRLLFQRLLQKAGNQSLDSPDNVAFVIGILQQFLAAGIPIQPATWLRPLAALGFQGRFDDFEKLSTWLAGWYSSADAQQRRLDKDLGRLFTPELQSALISWSFKHLDWKLFIKPKEHAREPRNPAHDSSFPWLRGPTLLKNLRDRYGVSVSLPALQQNFLFRVRQLHYATGAHRLASNRWHAHHVCGMHPDDYLTDWGELWDLPISDDEKKRLVDDIRKAWLSKKRQSSRAGWSNFTPAKWPKLGPWENSRSPARFPTSKIHVP